jgi:hypothetical protein
VHEALERDLEGRYATDRAFRRQYDVADSANRPLAGELEARWSKALARMAEVESKIVPHDEVAPATIGIARDTRGKTIWNAPSTDARLKKRIVCIVIHEVIADVDSEAVEIGSGRPLDRRRSRRNTHVPTAAWAAQRAAIQKGAARFADLILSRYII